MKLFRMIIVSATIVIAFIIGSDKYALAKSNFLSEYTQEAYTNDNGLPSTCVSDIIQTSDGYIWIASYNGLIRYDGTKFKNYNSDDKFNSNNIKTLFEDSKKRLWIGTNDSGIILYENGSFLNIGENEGYNSLSIRAISEDSEGNIIFGATDGIYIIDSKLEIEKVEFNLVNKTINNLVCDENDNIWALNSTGNLILLKKNGNDKVINNNDTNFTCVCKGKKDEILIGTSENEIIKVDIEDENNLSNIKKVDGKNNIKNLTYDSSGRLWVSFDDGIGFLDLVGNFISIDGAKIEKSIEKVYEDSEGNIWAVSSKEGILKLTKSIFKDLWIESGLKSDITNAIIKYNNQMYIGSDSGLSILDEKSETINNELTSYLNGVRIRNFLVDSKNNLWISTYNDTGLIKYDGNTIKSINTNNSKITDNKIRCVIENNDGSIIVGTNNGVNIIKNDEVIKTYTNKEGIKNSVILSLCTDDEGRIYVGSNGNGIYVIDNDKVKNYSKNIGLDSGVILRMIKDKKDDKVMITTGSSLYYFDNGSLEKINVDVGDNSIYDIKFANNNTVWLVATNGVYCVKYNDIKENKDIVSKLYGRKEGLSSIPTSNSWSYMDGSGNLYLCCTKGINTINTLESRMKTVYPRIEISDVFGDNILNKDDRDISLDSSCKKLRIKIDILSYSKGYDGKVVYYLDGFDSSPIEISKDNENIVTYTNLKGGKYKFYVRVLDDSGNIQSEKVIDINKKLGIFEYNSVKAITLILCILIMLLGYEIICRRRNKRLRKKQERYEKFIDDTIRVITNTIDAKDKYTNGHSQRVAEYSEEIAKRMKFTKEKVRDIYYIALLHDIGKIGIPDYILNKPGKLTKEEFEIIKTHTEIGWTILKDVNFIKNLAEGAKYHHERYDGKGYMEGLKGGNIPLVARIICVADTYDAMSTDRVYRKGLSDDEIIEEFKKCSGKQFDPEIVKIMINIIEEKNTNE